MGLFGIGGSKQDSSSRGESSSLDLSQSGSVSGGISGSQSEQAIAFEDVFARLFGGAEGAAAGLDPGLLTGAANQLFSGGTQFLESLGGDAGSQYLEGRLAGDNAVLEQQIDLLGSDLGDFFSEEINPALTSQAIGGGQLGGGRQGVAQGLAADALGEQFVRGATELRAGDIAARDAAATQLSQQGGQNAAIGLGALPSLLGVAETGTYAALGPSERLAAILGDPTVLTQANASAEDFARAFASSFGTSKSTQESSGSSRSFSFNPFG